MQLMWWLVFAVVTSVKRKTAVPNLGQHYAPRNKCTALILHWSILTDHCCPRLKEKNMGSVSPSVIYWKANEIIKRSLSCRENGRVIGQWLTCYYPCPRDPRGTKGAHCDVYNLRTVRLCIDFSGCALQILKGALLLTRTTWTSEPCLTVALWLEWENHKHVFT